METKIERLESRIAQLEQRLLTMDKELRKYTDISVESVEYKLDRINDNLYKQIEDNRETVRKQVARWIG